VAGAGRGRGPREVVVAHARAAEGVPRAKAPLSPSATSAVAVKGGAHARAASAPATSPELVPGEGTGFVTIDSYPWSAVAIDGVERGVTPIIRLPLAPGPHVVVLERPDGGRQSLAVDVAAGETRAERWLWE
jgi:hypothetical protein